MRGKEPTDRIGRALTADLTVHTLPLRSEILMTPPRVPLHIRRPVRHSTLFSSLIRSKKNHFLTMHQLRSTTVYAIKKRARDNIKR